MIIKNKTLYRVNSALPLSSTDFNRASAMIDPCWNVDQTTSEQHQINQDDFFFSPSTAFLDGEITQSRYIPSFLPSKKSRRSTDFLRQRYVSQKSLPPTDYLLHPAVLFTKFLILSLQIFKSLITNFLQIRTLYYKFFYFLFLYYILYLFLILYYFIF